MNNVCNRLGHEFIDTGIKQRDNSDEYKYKLYLCKRCACEHKIYLK